MYKLNDYAITKWAGELMLFFSRARAMLDKQDATVEVLEGVKEYITVGRKYVRDELYEKYEYLNREITDIKSTLSE